MKGICMGNTRTVTAIDATGKRPVDLGAQRPETAEKLRDTAPVNELHAAPVTRLPTLLGYLLLAVALYIGWRFRAEEYIVAETGLGYYLGIAGATMMVLLFLYPVRKRVRLLRNFGATKHWFRAHMIMGVAGPALILFHSNFRLGSMNSRVALISMLLVAGSGFVGRYIYTKIHYGLYGRRLTLKELRRDLMIRKNSLSQVLEYAPGLQKRLLDFDNAVLEERESFFKSFFHFFSISLRASWTHLALLGGLKRAAGVTAKRLGWSERLTELNRRQAREHICAHMRTAVMTAEFGVWERLFSLWHLFHMPLFIMMVIVTVVHILAVHMY